MSMYDLILLGSEKYDGDNMNYDPAQRIMDNEAAISMTKNWQRYGWQ